MAEELYSREVFVVVETRRKMRSKVEVKRRRMTNLQLRVWEKLCSPIMDAEQGLAMYEAAAKAEIDYICYQLKKHKNIDVEGVGAEMMKTLQSELKMLRQAEKLE